MRIDILTVLPELLSGPLSYSIVQRARDKGLLNLGIHSLRNYTHDRRRTVDDYAYGPDAGMVLKPEPIFEAVEALQAFTEYDEIIYTSPDGEVLSQAIANELSTKGNLLILCGHYKGVDQRVRDRLVTREISIGDYVLSGGELAAAVIVDAIARLLPGAIGDETSALSDSFQDGLLAPPVYTRPANFGVIEQWQYDIALERTRQLRPDLYARYMGTENATPTPGHTDTH